MSRIVVVVGHPRTGTFCEALGASYLHGARQSGHEAEMFVASRMTFDPILHYGAERMQPLEADLAAVREAILAADHLVWVFPLWMGTMPALLKGFLERVFQPEVLASAGDGRLPQVLAGKSARIVMTMGMPGVVYRWWYGAHALSVFKRNILGFIGAGPIRSTIFGMVEAVDDAERQSWLAEIEGVGRSAG